MRAVVKSFLKEGRGGKCIIKLVTGRRYLGWTKG